MIADDFNTMEQFLEFVNADDYTRHASATARPSWTGSNNFDHALDIAREGVNMDRVALEINKLHAHHEHVDLVYAVAGSNVEMGRYMSGEPECMMQFMEVENPKMVVLNFEITESGSKRTSIFEAKAISIASLVDELEARGVRVKLNVIGQMRKVLNMEDMQLKICVKNFHENLSVSQLIGACHTSFFRRLMFAWMEKKMQLVHNKNYDLDGYGYPPENPPTNIEGIYVGNTNQFWDDNKQVYIEHYLQKIKSMYQL